MPIHVTPTNIPDLLLIEPQIFQDDRGCFFESFNQKQFAEAIGKNVNFVQDNQSTSKQGVIRGLHYQLERPQGKLVRVVSGQIYDVVVDLRRRSPTYGQWLGFELSADNRRQLWIPEGFAHGFLTLSRTADVCYKTSDYWSPQSEKCIYWNDSDLKITWPQLDINYVISKKDSMGLDWLSAPKFCEVTNG